MNLRPFEMLTGLPVRQCRLIDVNQAWLESDLDPDSSHVFLRTLSARPVMILSAFFEGGTTEPWGQAKFDRACFVPLSAELER